MAVSRERGYYGYTEGEWRIMCGDDGTTGMQLIQSRAKEQRRFRLTDLGRNERRKPCKNALAQAMRFEFNLGPVQIGKLLNMAPQDVTRITVLESCPKGIPWEMRQNQAETIQEAKQIMDQAGVVPQRSRELCRDCEREIVPPFQRCALHRRIHKAAHWHHWNQQRRKKAGGHGE